HGKRPGLSPAVHHPPPQDGGEPGPVPPPLFVSLAALPGGTKRLLHHVFRLVPVPHHAVGDPEQRGTMVIDQRVKLSQRQRQTVPRSSIQIEGLLRTSRCRRREDEQSREP